MHCINKPYSKTMDSDLSDFIRCFQLLDGTRPYAHKPSLEVLNAFGWKDEETFIQKKFAPLFKIYKAFSAKLAERETALSLQQLRDDLDVFIQEEDGDFVVKDEFVPHLKELLDKVADKDISSIKTICGGFDEIRYDNIRLFVYAFAYNLDIPFDLIYYGNFFCLFNTWNDFYSKPEKVKVSDVVDLLKKKQKILYSARHIRDVCKELGLETTKDAGRPKKL